MEKGLTTLKGLFVGDNVFRVPIYQRYYSWGEKQWDDLWSDFFYLNPLKKHYFGTILLKSTGQIINENLEPFDGYEIIDGQQRVTTIIILIREIVNQLKSLNNPKLEKRLEKIESDYLRYETVYKLELQGDDNNFFKEYIINNEEYPADALTNSQKRLKKAKIFFRKKLEDLYTENSSNYKDYLLELKHKIDNLEIILYDVDNDSDAVLIFETVNDRGKPLTNLEKTKSFLMHIVYLSSPKNTELYLDSINHSFSKIFRWFEEIKTSKRGKNLNEDDIQRYHFIIFQRNLKNRMEASNNYIEPLKEKIKELNRTDSIKSLNYVLEYTKDLEKAFYIMKEIITYANDDKIGHFLHRIFVLDRVANFFPLLIAIWLKYYPTNNNKITPLLKLIEIASFRLYAIGKRKTNAGGSFLYKLAFEVHRETIDEIEIQKSIIDNLIKVYADDRGFERDLKVENFYTKVSNRDKKYLLYYYNNHLQNEAKEIVEFSLDKILDPYYEIEHIWPNSTKKLHLSKKKELEHDNSKHKLGNLTIATHPWNAQWQDSPFETKKKYYEDSVLRVQKELKNYKKWDLEEILIREHKIIEFAMNKWKIPKINELHVDIDKLKLFSEIFNKRFSHWNIVLPEEHIKYMRKGYIQKAGWLIQYCFGNDKEGEYLDYYAAHRMTDDSHVRIYNNGKVENLPALQGMYLTSEDPKEAKRLEEEYFIRNRKITEILAEKGFDKFTLNMFLHTGLDKND